MQKRHFEQATRFEVRNHRLTSGSSKIPFVRSPNVGGALNPVFLVIHYTASGAAGIAEYFSRPAAKVSAHLVIRRDGSVKQCVPFNVVGWHAGASEWRARDGRLYTGLNQHAIGIEIENLGPLTRTATGYVGWEGTPVDGSRVMEARHKNGGPVRGWEVFTGAQVEATVEAARAICSAYNIGEIVGHDDISPGRKTDPGPAWNMDSLRAKVFGRSEDAPGGFVVRSPTGLNVRTGAGVNFPLARPNPLPDGTPVIGHEADGAWRFVSVLNGIGQAQFSGWVHGGFLRDA